MSLANFLIANLIVVSNLTFFFNRLITDGNYKTVLLNYDDVNCDLKDTNFDSELAGLASENYAMYIMKSNYSQVIAWEVTPIKIRFGVLEILTLNYDNDGKKRMRQLLQRNDNSRYTAASIVLLIPMQSDERKKEFWQCFSAATRYFPYINASVVFYQTERSVKMANTSRELIEIFALNHYDRLLRRTQNVDVKNSIFDVGELIEGNLNEKIFGSISKKPNLVINTFVSAAAPPKRGSDLQLVNIGDANQYHSNFITQNLRNKDAVIRQTLQYGTTELINGKYTIKGSLYQCNISNEKIYAELHNTLRSPKRTQNELFVFTVYTLKPRDCRFYRIYVFFCSQFLQSWRISV